MSTWNYSFTQLIRRNWPTYWGNWNLNPDIKVGAVGFLNPDTGEFTLMKESIEGIEVKTNPESIKWQLATEHVKRTETQLAAEGSATDAKTGIQGEAEAKISWEMMSAGSIASEFAISHIESVNNIGIIDHLKEPLAAIATDVNCVDPNGNPTQGFGVITNVIWANSGLNVGALEDNSTFSISGSVSAMQELLGKAKGSGSYTEYESNKSVAMSIWPDEKNATAPTPIPIAYEFTSFVGAELVPTWTKRISDFHLLLNCKFGCTYIHHADIHYTTPKGPVNEYRQLLMGQLFSVEIPPDASNIDIDIIFTCVLNNESHKFHWDNPRLEWPSGQRQIDTWGIWPGPTFAQDMG